MYCRQYVVFQITYVKNYFNFRSGCLKAGNANVLFPRAPSSVISKVLIRLNLIKACQYDIELTSQFLLNRIQNLDDRSKNSRDSLESLNVLLLYLYLKWSLCIPRSFIRSITKKCLCASDPSSIDFRKGVCYAVPGHLRAITISLKLIKSKYPLKTAAWKCNFCVIFPSTSKKSEKMLCRMWGILV